MSDMSDDDDKQTSLDAFANSKQRSLDLGSNRSKFSGNNNSSTKRYHDMGKLYPNAPVPRVAGGLVIHRAMLHDVTGTLQLMDWLADGEAAIVRMERLMGRDLELEAAIEKLTQFIEVDMGGQIIGLTDSRLMLLPPGCRGVNGLDSEAFASEKYDFR